MSGSFKSSFFINNRQKLRAQSKSDLIIISANHLVQKSADLSYPFRQDSNFWYLTGINEPDITLVLYRDEEYLIVPKLNAMRQIFDGNIDNSELILGSGVKQILGEKEGWLKLEAQLNKTKSAATLLPSPIVVKPYGFYAQPARRTLVTRLKRLKSGLEFEDLRPVLARQRMAKQPEEVTVIKKAIEITNQTLSEVLESGRLAKYRHASQIETDILHGFKTRGASGHGFDPIVASGKYATTIHYEGDQLLNKNELIVVDVGAEVEFYTADISRTVSYDKPSSREIEVFESVKYVQQEAIKLIKPGLDIKAYEIKVEQMIGQQLIKLRLIKKNDRKNVRHYYPHACSHSLGIDTHDSADYTEPLPINMVMTVEPGIYIPEEGIGVRIEDDVIITEEGSQVLSSSLPRSLVI
jgi:Xaa-Pro aminopeptidase